MADYPWYRFLFSPKIFVKVAALSAVSDPKSWSFVHVAAYSVGLDPLRWLTRYLLL